MDRDLARELLTKAASFEANLAVILSAPTRGPFSHLAGTIAYTERYTGTVAVLSLFGIDMELLLGSLDSGPPIAEAAAAVDRLVQFFKLSWLPHRFVALDGAGNKKQAFILLATCVLSLLSGECILSVTEYSDCSAPRKEHLPMTKLQKSQLGMGTKYTWHGSPDA